MSIPTKPAKTTMAKDLLGHFTIAVIEVEHPERRVYIIHSYDDTPARLERLPGQFDGRAAAKKLRAIADHLEAVDWAGLGQEGAA